MTHVQGSYNYRAMKKFTLGCYLLLAQFCTPLFGQSEEDRTCQSHNSAMQIVSQLRDLEFRKNVRCRALNSKQFQEIFSDRIEPQVDSERLANEGIVYKILGFIPNDFNLVFNLSRLSTQLEQVVVTSKGYDNTVRQPILGANQPRPWGR